MRQVIFEPPPDDGLPHREYDRVDWWLLRETCISHVASDQLLDETLAELGALGYFVVEIDARRWSSADDFYDEMAAHFDYPASYGHGPDAFNDAWSEVAYYEHGSDPQSTGTVVAVRHFEHLDEIDHQTACWFVDIWASNAWRALLIGHPMILLLHAPSSQKFVRAKGLLVKRYDRRPTFD